LPIVELADSVSKTLGALMAGRASRLSEILTIFWHFDRRQLDGL
jgi:hypothetical protein